VLPDDVPPDDIPPLGDVPPDMVPEVDPPIDPSEPDVVEPPDIDPFAPDDIPPEVDDPVPLRDRVREPRFVRVDRVEEPVDDPMLALEPVPIEESVPIVEPVPMLPLVDCPLVDCPLPIVEPPEVLPPDELVCAMASAGMASAPSAKVVKIRMIFSCGSVVPTVGKGRVFPCFSLFGRDEVTSGRLERAPPSLLRPVHRESLHMDHVGRRWRAASAHRRA